MNDSFFLLHKFSSQLYLYEQRDIIRYLAFLTLLMLPNKGDTNEEERLSCFNFLQTHQAHIKNRNDMNWHCTGVERNTEL